MMASHVFKLSDYRLFVHHIIKIFLVVIVLSSYLIIFLFRLFSADNKMMALIIMKLPLDKYYALIATALTTATLG